MRELILVFIILGAIHLAHQEPIEDLDQILVYPVEPETKKTKREATKTKKRDFNEFVEDKLIQHTQALEHLVKLVESNEEVTKQLVETLSQNMGSPKLPDKIESRRTLGGGPVLAPNQQNRDSASPWCTAALLCKRRVNQVCGYDNNFGYGKFDDVCHMLQVNCYWNYNFSIVPSCRPLI